MKALTRTMIVLTILTLITADVGIAQPVPTPAKSAATSSRISSRVQSEVGRDQREVDRLMRSISLSTGRRSGTSTGTSTGNTVLVIPTEEMKTEDLLTINEDMSVMSRIIDNELNRERLSKSNMSWSFSGDRWSADNFATFFGRDGGKTGSMYLQGYGALFMMKVDFPLSAGPDVQEQEDEETEKEDVDHVWEQTRQQIYEPQETSRRRRGTDRTEVKYDAEKVENLKTSLVQALKHAANIRILKPDESLILSITGSGASSNVVGIMTNRTDQIMVIEEAGGKQSSRIYEGGLPEDIKFSSPTVLVIRAKKSDIDTFAKGDLNFDKFHEKVQILSYPLLSGNVAGTSTSLTLPTRTGTGTF